MDLLNSVMLAENNPALGNRNTCPESEALLESLNEETCFGEALDKRVLKLEMQGETVSFPNPGTPVKSLPKVATPERFPLPSALTGEILPEELSPETETLPCLEQRCKDRSFTGSAYKPAKSAGYREAFSSGEMMELEKALAVLNENRRPPFAPMTSRITKTPVVNVGEEEMMESEERREFSPSEEINLSQYGVPPQENILLLPLETPTENRTPGDPEPDLSGEVVPAARENGKDPRLSDTLRENKGKPEKKKKQGNMEISGAPDKKTEQKTFPEKRLPQKIKWKLNKEPVFLKNKHQLEDLPFQKGEPGTHPESEFSPIPANMLETIPFRRTIVPGGDHSSIPLETSGERAIGEGLAHMVSFLKNEKGDRKGVLRVEPPELGKVRIVINSSDDEVQVHLTVERAEAGDLIKSSEDVLRDAMKRQGLTLGDLAVDVGNGGRESYSGKERNTFSGQGISKPENPEPEEDGTVLARIDLEQGILHWIA